MIILTGDHGEIVRPLEYMTHGSTPFEKAITYFMAIRFPGQKNSTSILQQVSQRTLSIFHFDLFKIGLNKDNFYLLGHSWGGILAMQYALKYQNNMKALIISNMMSSCPDYGKYADEVLAKQFDKPVLVNVLQEDVWQVGFITQDNVKQLGLEEYVAVYVPQSYAFAGHLYMVKPDRIKPIDKLSSAEAMKFTISGGIAE
jgi:uncharacterized membrane protein